MAPFGVAMNSVVCFACETSIGLLTLRLLGGFGFEGAMS